MYRSLILACWVLTIVALLFALTGCEPERTSDEPRPAIAPCDRCGPRPTLTPEQR